MTYEALRDAEKDRKPVVWILEFPDHGQRFVSSRAYTGLASSASPGLKVTGSLAAELDLKTGHVDFDDIEVRVLDSDGTAGSFLAANDASLQAARVILKYGFQEVSEAEFRILRFFLDDWSLDNKGGFIISLRSALGFLDRPLFEDFENDSFTLVSLTSFSLDLQGDAIEAGWRSAGHALVSDQNTNEVELVSYTGMTKVAQDQTRLSGVTRRKFDVGAEGKVFPVDGGASVQQAWAFNEHPVDLFLRLATTTEGGGNGPDDAADGDGLGDMLSFDALDRPALLRLRQRFATDSNGAPLKGLYIGTEDIESLLEMFEQEFLAMGLVMNLTADRRVTLRELLIPEGDAQVITGKVNEGKPIEWERGYSEAENTVRWSYDYNPASGDYLTHLDRADTESQARYGQAKLRKVESRGLRGVSGRSFGFPDLGWDGVLVSAAGNYLTLLGNPSTPVRIEGHLALQDLEVGTLVQLTHQGIFNLATGKRGITDTLFYVVRTEPRPDRGHVLLDLQERRLIGRPWFISPDFTVPKYRVNFTTSAGEAFEGWENADKGVLYPTAGRGVDGTGTLGWLASAGDADRDRDDLKSPDERYDSLAFASNAASSERTFRMALANGTYRVRIVVGDTIAQASQRVVANGVTFWDGNLGTAAYEWLEKELLVEVTSGVLDVQIGGGGNSGNTTMNWLEVMGENPIDDYNNATEAEKQYGFIPPDAGNFPDGGAPYDTGI